MDLEAVRETGAQTNNERENRGSIQRACKGGWGQGPRPIQPARDTGTRVSLPSSSPDLAELDPGEQCKRGEGRGRRGEDNISGKKGELSSVTITDRQGFISQLRSKDRSSCLFSRPRGFRRDKVIWKSNDHNRLHRCVFQDDSKLHCCSVFQHKSHSSRYAS